MAMSDKSKDELEMEAVARDIAAEGLAQGAAGAAELGAAMAEEMEETESSA